MYGYNLVAIYPTLEEARRVSDRLLAEGLTADSVRLTDATTGTSGMFNAAMPGDTAPGGNASLACAVTTAWLPRKPMRAAATYDWAISTATSGADVWRRSLKLIRRMSPC